MTSVRVLFLEDNPTDFELELHCLKRAGIGVTTVCVQTESDYLKLLETFSPDLIIADYALPGYDGLSALDAAQRVCPEVPLLFISGTAGEDIAVEALKRGATDYLLKQNLKRLESAAQRAIAEAEKKKDLKRAEQQVSNAAVLYKSLVESLPLYVYRTDLLGRFTFVNHKYCQLHGQPAGQMIGKIVSDFEPPDAARRLAELDSQTLASGMPVETELEMDVPGAGRRTMSLINAPLFNACGQTIGLQGIFSDITESRKAQARIERLNQLLRGIRDINSLIVKERDPKKLLLLACETLVQTRGYLLIWVAGVERGSARLSPLARAGQMTEYVDVVAVAWDESPIGRGPIGTSIREREARIVNDTASDPAFVPWRDAALARGFKSVASFPILHESRVFGALVVYADRPGAFDPEEKDLLTELAADLGFALRSIEHQAESELFQKQFLQAQKMEAVGRLAGGIAHDFNNLLTIILGCCNFLLADIPADSPARADVEHIHNAGLRAADLTSKLLAFSRKQVLQPKVLDLNAVVKDSFKLLSRVIGEDIELIIIPGDNLGRIKADLTQVEQVIMNLAVNARDAMPKGGKLIISSDNAELDQEFISRNSGSCAGSFVALSVSDTGTGMDDEVKSHLFDPFFTTKPEGKGTGLGLSTVYGIVKQNGGYISVDSSPGCGATFKVYFPRFAGDVETPRIKKTGAVNGTETILLVGDVAEIRALARRTLTSKGYHVLEAEDGPQALEVADGYADRIHLLVTDVILPGGMNGRDLIQKLQALRRDINVLYISGYAGAFVEDQLPAQGFDLLTKPFSCADLVRKVSEVICKNA